MRGDAGESCWCDRMAVGVPLIFHIRYYINIRFGAAGRAMNALHYFETDRPSDAPVRHLQQAGGVSCCLFVLIVVHHSPFTILNFQTNASIHLVIHHDSKHQLVGPRVAVPAGRPVAPKAKVRDHPSCVALVPNGLINQQRPPSSPPAVHSTHTGHDA